MLNVAYHEFLQYGVQTHKNNEGFVSILHLGGTWPNSGTPVKNSSILQDGVFFAKTKTDDHSMELIKLKFLGSYHVLVEKFKTFNSTRVWFSAPK
jgi:hypothetical protein